MEGWVLDNNLEICVEYPLLMKIQNSKESKLNINNCCNRLECIKKQAGAATITRNVYFSCPSMRVKHVQAVAREFGLIHSHRLVRI